MPRATPRPFTLLAELTYRCPLHCPYCSNPSKFQGGKEELSTDEWKRVIAEAAELGVLHIGFSGGEPLTRSDIVELTAAARTAGLYSNLITSALGLTRRRAEELKAAGLDSIQISFQSDEEALANKIAGTQAHARKLEAARMVRELAFPLTVNVVLHRGNIDRLEQIIALAIDLGAERLELANTQFYGWAFDNRRVLLPTRLQIDAAYATTNAAQKSLWGKMEVIFVVPDYYGVRPKPCMHGWGNRHLTVNPIGDVLPCPTASHITSLRFENIRKQSLEWIWAASESFNQFRGTDWMPEPCQSCELRTVDFGGCRCQAALLTGDPTATDPACALSPYRASLTELVESIQRPSSGHNPFSPSTPGLVYRTNPA